MQVPIDDIIIEDRIREDVKGSKDDWAFFLNSFLIHGQLQPIKVELQDDGKYRLIAGGRRVTAMTEIYRANKIVKGLQYGFIEATYSEPVPLHTKLLQEFAENNERKDFTFVEKAKFIRKFHDGMQLQFGKDTWSQEMTAHSLNLSPASISHYLRVEQAVKNDPTIAKAGTLDAAVKRMKVQESIDGRKDAVNAESPEAITRAEQIIHHGDAREWIRNIASESVDFVNFDPPWGNDASFKSQENHETFDDSTEYARQLMVDLLPEIYRVLKNDRFCAFWFGAHETEQMANFATHYGFNLQFTRTPCIWYKPDKVADQNRMPEKQLIESYETFLLLRKGNPVFYERFAHNVFAFDRVALAQIIHPTEKPIELCNALIKLTTVPGELVLDPTSGSSAFLDSSIRNNRRALGCELSENYHNRGIVRLAEYLKTFSEKK